MNVLPPSSSWPASVLAGNIWLCLIFTSWLVGAETAAWFCKKNKIQKEIWKQTKTIKLCPEISLAMALCMLFWITWSTFCWRSSSILFSAFVGSDRFLLHVDFRCFLLLKPVVFRLKFDRNCAQNVSGSTCISLLLSKQRAEIYMHILISFYLKIIIKQVRLDTLVAHLSLRTGQVRVTPSEGERAGVTSYPTAENSPRKKRCYPLK